jgi:hypothetical protein
LDKSNISSIACRVAVLDDDSELGFRAELPPGVDDRRRWCPCPLCCGFLIALDALATPTFIADAAPPRCACARADDDASLPPLRCFACGVRASPADSRVHVAFAMVCGVDIQTRSATARLARDVEFA